MSEIDQKKKQKKQPEMGGAHGYIRPIAQPY